MKKASGDLGYCGQPASAEWSRYQGGLLMVLAFSAGRLFVTTDTNLVVCFAGR